VQALEISASPRDIEMSHREDFVWKELMVHWGVEAVGRLAAQTFPSNESIRISMVRKEMTEMDMENMVLI
jgi:hypothetical protein